MASGGARGRSGPPPDPTALRRDRADDAAGWITLPATGRPGPAPEWPLTHQSTREKQLWDAEWRRPQAIMWERNGQEIEVALYVKRLAEVEITDAPVSLGTLVRQMQEGLGLSQPGLQRNRWKIAEATGPQSAAPRTGNVVSARDRFRKAGGSAGSA